MGILGTPLGIKQAPANPPGRINLPAQGDLPVQIQADPPMGILRTPLGIKHAPANHPGPINMPSQEEIPVQIQADPPMCILGRPMGCDMLLWRISRKPRHRTWRIRSFNPLMWGAGWVAQCELCAKLESFFGNNPDVFFLNLLT